MNLREWLSSKIDQNCFPPAHSKTVVDMITSCPELEELCGRWDEDANSFNAQPLATIWLIAADKVIEWIDTYCPRAWYRNLFITDLLLSTSSAAAGDAAGGPTS